MPTSTFPDFAQQSRFYDPIVIVLGRMTGFKDDVDVPASEVILAAVREVGLDPDALPDNFPFHGRRGLARRVHLAWRQQRAGCYREKKDAYTRPGDAKMLWGLTAKGVERARALCASKKPPQNITAQWFNKNYTKVYPAMVAAVTKKMSVSARAGLVEDHVQGYILKAISRDAFAIPLRLGVPLPVTKVASYAVRSAITDIRDWATDPVARELLGARTDQERRRAMDEAECIAVAPDPRQVVYMSQDGVTRLLDVRDDRSVADAEHKAVFSALWSRVEGAVRKVKPQASPRYMRLFELQVMEGYLVEEVAAREGISIHRAASMLAEVRQALYTAREQGAFEGFAAP